MSTIKPYIEVVKPRTVILLSYVGLISGIVAYQRVGVGIEKLLLSFVGVVLGAMGTNAITCYIDRDIDGIMERTKNRPIPRGAIKPPEKALVYGVILVLIGLTFTLLTKNYWSSFWLIFGVLIVSLVYNGYLKRKNPVNIIIASPGGGAPVMVVWSGVTGESINVVPLLMAALVVVWTPVHIWSLALKYREDYEKAHVPMLPTVFSEEAAIKCIAATSTLLVLFSTILGFLLLKPPIYYILLTLINLVLLYHSIGLLLNPEKNKAWRLFKITSPYLAIAFTILLI